MNIVVCIKRVPMTQEVDLEIDGSRNDVKKEALAYVINDWDNYAIEESVLLKEKFGGSVTAITIGREDDEEVLRRALAMGADRAIRIDSGERIFDSFVMSKLLAETIKDLEYDLILTGVQADDDNCGAVGVMLAEHLGISHAAVVTSVEPKGDRVAIRVELEGGMDEVSKIGLPALFTVQTGINEPRYVSILGIRKAGKKELKVVEIQDLNIKEEELSPYIIVEEVFFPPEAVGAEILSGDPSVVAGEILRILKEKGVSI